MSDLTHVFGSDLSVSANGDLATLSGGALGQQRVLRRLLTNAGDYIWQLTYGAGLPAMIGMPVQADVISGLVQSQIFLEPSVARSPAPTVTVEASGNIVSLAISYSDANEASVQAVGISITS